MADDERRVEPVDIGSGHHLRPMYGEDETIVGYIDAHRTPQGKGCGGFASIVESVGGPATWRATGSLEDGTLTLEPSLLCRTCGDHGWVRDGRWVVA